MLYYFFKVKQCKIFIENTYLKESSLTLVEKYTSNVIRSSSSLDFILKMIKIPTRKTLKSTLNYHGDLNQSFKCIEKSAMDTQCQGSFQNPNNKSFGICSGISPSTRKLLYTAYGNDLFWGPGQVC